MGSGKTTLGKKLAPALNLSFIDLDEYIEEKEQQSIPTIFEKHGEAVFRKLEAKYLNEILKIQQPLVVALGGGTVCFENNLQPIKKNGILVYIDVPASALAERLVKARKPRPLFKGLEPREFEKKIKELLDQRLVYYQQAHLTVDGSDLTPKLLQKQIVEFSQT